MSWRSSGKTNIELVETLKKNGLIKTTGVYEAMKAVDRKNYMIESHKTYAYQDSPQSIGYSVTISAPHMHAMQLELLHAEPGQTILDVGSGSGIICAYLGKIVGKEGKVYGIDHIKELVDWSIENIKNDSPDLIEDGIVNIVEGDGFVGLPDLTFDAIHVGAAAPEIPQALIDQLKVGGHLVIPVGTYSQSLYDVIKTEDKIVQNYITGVRFVPLCSKKEQIN
ncbi:protein-l-isoaspartate(d-aspartate) o-methyltransferase [Anaeramoeba ignava]|uniref:protein-L-isoaspartate(D-aspartate) O-methyltransferase n=1 Tax=Anaeramoeba ignava TaxID=1746090 RepID=A0A9Q0RDU6_ANAIG|nr:protein-l-isoaspartate(d-aspartate) o-methyltransferase [Anaeramoeba ignava]